MADWINKIDLKPIWNEFDTTQDFEKLKTETSKAILKVAETTKYYKDEFIDIAEQFEACDNIGEYDYCMEELYDLGDVLIEAKNFHNDRKLCWINTM